MTLSCELAQWRRPRPPTGLVRAGRIGTVEPPVDEPAERVVGRELGATRLSEVVGKPCVNVDDSAAEAVRLMRDNALRRLPVLDDDRRVVGIVSLGDLAVDRDPDSALADISKAPPSQ